MHGTNLKIISKSLDALDCKMAVLIRHKVWGNCVMLRVKERELVTAITRHEVEI